MLRNTLTPYHTSIDAAAEAEGEAVERLHDLVDTPLPLPRLRYLRELREMAAELGVAPRPKAKYPRQAIIRRWLRVVESFQRSTMPPASCFPRSRPERNAASERRRQQKAERLMALESAELPEAVTIREAAALLGMHPRKVEERLRVGDLSKHRAPDGRRVMIFTADLRQFQRERLAVPRRAPAKLAA